MSVLPASLYPSRPVVSWGSQWLKRPGKPLQRIMVPALGPRCTQQPADLPPDCGSRDLGATLSCTGQRSPPQPAISGPAHCAPRSSAVFSISPENSLLHPCFHLSGEFQKKSKQEFHLCGDTCQAWEHSARVVPSPWKVGEGWRRLWSLGCLENCPLCCLFLGWALVWWLGED